MTVLSLFNIDMSNIVNTGRAVMPDSHRSHPHGTAAQSVVASSAEGVSPIRALRKSAGLTQGQLGQHAGVTRQTIAAIEKGDYAPSVYLALRIAQRLDSTVEHLFPLDKEPS